MDYDEYLTVFGDFVKGTCELMCPVSEIKMRERERLLHPLERLAASSSNEVTSSNVRSTKYASRSKSYQADPHKVVKAFNRSAAGLKMPAASDLRPFLVLDMTVSYLIKEIACNEINTQGWVERYNFVTDRLRAVRQDMVIQSLAPAECIKLLEPMVKFHAFAGYWLCEKPIHKFDPKINASFLQECIKRLLVLYDMVGENGRVEVFKVPNGNDAHPLLKNDTPCGNAEHLMRALYLIINLGNAQALNQQCERLVNVMCVHQSCVEIQAFQCSLESWRGNYVKVCRLTRKLPYLLCMAAAVQLPSVRRHALMVMSSAYSNKTLQYPISILQDMLLWTDNKQVIEECKYYGIQVEDQYVKFQKGIFNGQIKQAQTTRLDWLDKALSTSAVTKILIEH